MDSYRLSNLKALEAESIFILREVVAEFERPVMLYSIGKDSSVLVHLARKAFHPAPIPFPLLHVDTGFKFPEMISFRDRFCREIGARLIVHQNQEAIAAGANPWASGTVKCCGSLKTQALLAALHAALPAEPQGGATVAVDENQLSEVCAQLQALLADDDAAAVRLLGAHADLLRSAFGEGFRAIDDALRGYDFEAALAALHAALLARRTE